MIGKGMAAGLIYLKLRRARGRTIARRLFPGNSPMDACSSKEIRIAPLAATALICLSCATAGLGDARASDAVRGELLYNTHCVACHSTKMHWRSQRLASDWKSLTVQVRRWQSAIQLNWNEEDIASTAAYLNRLYYQFPEPPHETLGLRADGSKR
jgi:hypothetical protein